MHNTTFFFLSFVLFFFGCSNILLAQKNGFGIDREQVPCGSTELYQKQMQDHPQLQKAWEDLERAAYQAQGQPTRRRQANYTLPVVIHIIHDNGPENLTDAQVITGMQHLNDAFANVNYYDQGLGVDTGFEFCLARRAPDGSATTGINRVQSPLTVSTLAQGLDVKALSRWSSFDYINLWIVRDLSLGSNGSLAGYANLPMLHGQPRDGIVMEARWFGSSNANSGVQIHEMGHYLGLYHTFQGGCSNNDCALNGDRVCDTPPDQSTAAVPCGASANSCTTDTDSGFATDQDDHYWNYMDYGDWNCYGEFTQGQTDRMTFFIEGQRKSLLMSDGCSDPCPVSPDLSIDVAPAQVQVGTTLTFTLTAPALTQFEWFVNNVSAGTGPSLTYTFTNKGHYTISVEGGNGNPLCQGFDFIELEVTCPVIADFTASASQVFVNESVLFSSTSTNATSLAWYVDGVFAGNANSFSELFTEEGNHEVVLVAENAICSDTSGIFYVFVVHPCGQGGTKRLESQSQRPSQIRKLADGGLLTIYRGGANSSIHQIVRLDDRQNLLWVKVVDIGDHVLIRDMVEDPSDNGLLFCGRVEENGEDKAYIFKLDATGNYLWGHKTVLGERLFNYIYPAVGGDFLVAGRIESFPPADTVQIVKIQTDGTLLWSKTYTGLELWDFEVMTDGTMYVSGEPRFYPGSFSSAALAHLDADGNVLRSSRYTDPFLRNAFHYRFSSMTENEVGGMVIAYSMQDTTFKKFDVLVSTDANGDVLWTNKYYYGYQRSNYETEGPVHALTQTPDGGYVFYSTLTNDLLSVLVKVDAQGEILWSRHLASAFNLLGEYPRIEVLDNGNLVVGHRGNLFVLDQNGLLGPCPVTDVPSEIYDHVMIKEVAGFEYQGGVLFTNAPATISNGSLNLSPSCETQNAMEPDAAVSTIDAGLCNGVYTLNWQVCNIGTGTIPSGTPYTFYDGDPTSSNAPVILTQNLSMNLLPGNCQTLQTSIPTLPANTVHLIFNDDGTITSPFNLITDVGGAAFLIECNFFNNLDSLSLDNLPMTTPNPFLGNDTTICSSSIFPLSPGVFSSYLWQDGTSLDSLKALAPGTYSVTVTDACGVTQVDDITIQWHSPSVLNLGPDVVLCENGVLPLDAGPDFETYLWSDGSNSQQTTAWLSGEYSVTATDACGGVQSDTVLITIDPATVLDLPEELNACVGATLPIAVPGYLNYEWLPGGILDCDNCANVVFSVDQERTFYLLVETMAGCFSSDSIKIVVQDTIETFDQNSFCTGDSVLVFGQWIKSPGDYSDRFLTVDGCDSVHTIRVDELSPISSNEDLSICAGDSSLIFGVWEKTAAIYSAVFPASNGCDSTHFVDLKILDTLRSNDQMSICAGDSILLFGSWEKTAGTYAQIFSTNLGCDSIHSIELAVLDTFRIQEEWRICRDDSVLIFGVWEKTAGIYSQIFPSSQGCDSTQIFELILLDTLQTNEQLSICRGDSALIFGTWEKTAAIYAETFSSSFGCDSTHRVDLQVVDTFLTTDQLTICAGDSAFIFGDWEKTAGIYVQFYTSSFGCDSTHSVDLILQDTFLSNAQWSICEGDSAFIFDAWEKTEGTYLKTWTSALGCDSTAVIQLVNLPAAETSEQRSICSGDSVLVFGAWVYDSGVFRESYAVAGACDSVHQITVQVEDEILLDAVTEWTIAPGDSIALEVNFLPNISNPTYEWSPAIGLSCTDCRSPIATPSANTSYQLILRDEQGCTASLEILVKVEEVKRSIYLPTAFSPNDDSNNDVLYPQGITGSAEVLRFSIYDRWGEVVFENTNFALNKESAGWDGTFKRQRMMSGVYVAILEVIWENGQREVMSSDVMLFR